MDIQAIAGSAYSLTKEELIQLALDAGLTQADLKVTNKFDELKELRSSHKEKEDELKQQAIETLPWATDEQVHEICEAIENGDDDAKKLINHRKGFRINEYQEGLIEIAEGNRMVDINTDDAKAGFAKQIQNAAHINKATFGRPKKTGKFAGKGIIKISAYVG